jgi:alkaline phosphatase D
VAGVTPVNRGLPDASRRIMSSVQQDWLTSGIGASTASWQFLGSQDIMARLWLPASVLQKLVGVAVSNPPTATEADVIAAISAYLDAKATRAAAGAGALTPAQAGLLDPALNPLLPYNLDAWDGYPVQREVILNTIKSLNKNLVVLSGDSHNAWFNHITTMAGVKVGVEFAGSSVSAPGLERVGLGALAASLDGSALVPQLGNAVIGAGLGLVDDLAYAETTRRGYLLMTVTSASVKGEYVFVDTVKSKPYQASIGRTITVSSSGQVSYA